MKILILQKTPDYERHNLNNPHIMITEYNKTLMIQFTIEYGLNTQNTDRTMYLNYI